MVASGVDMGAAFDVVKPTAVCAASMPGGETISEIFVEV
jgi:hypothetical protein